MSPFAVGAIAGMGGCSLLLILLYLQFKSMQKRLLHSFEKELRQIVNNQQIQSDIETAFDDFVRNRLAGEMPVFTMFLDDALIEELNQIFKKELDTRLPALLDGAMPGKAALAPLWGKLQKHWLSMAGMAWLCGVLSTALITYLLC